MTIRSYLEKFAAETPDALAMEFFGSDKRWHTTTWAAFRADVACTADAYGGEFALAPQQENAALMLPNSPVWVEAYLAQSGAGVAVVPIDPKLRSSEVEYILSDSGTVVLTTDKAHLDMMREIAPRLPALRAIVLADGEPAVEERAGNARICGYASLKAGARPGWFERHVANMDDVASVIYTSGTTGKPKGAMLTHGNFIADIQGAYSEFGDIGISQSDSLFVVLPLFHAFSFCTNFVLSLYRGMKMCFNRSLYTVGEDMRTLKPTIVMAVPLLAEKLLARIESKLEESCTAKMLSAIGLRRIVLKKVCEGLGGRLRFIVVGGAPCPHHVLEGFKKLGIAVIEGYGLTECSPVVSIASPRNSKIGTIGKKLVNIDIRLADANDQGVGELQIKGPITMKGYWHNEDATKEAFDGQWLKTGDLASIDEAGLITIRGRKKALIVNREGKNIYPEEVENRIASDPLVADCIVIGYTTGGIPGEKVGCIVHPDEDLLREMSGGGEIDWAKAEKLTVERIHAKCAELADYKRVRKIVVKREPLERTSIQKVRRVAYKGALDE